MPKSLLQALHHHPKLSNRAALFSCWGLNEDRQTLEDLGTTANFSEFVIDFGPRHYVTAEGLAESVFCQKQLLLRQQTMKCMTIRNRYDNTHRFIDQFIDQVQMEREKLLPSIEKLSLERYRFDVHDIGIQCHINAQSLRSLTSVACANLQVLLIIARLKLSQLIIWVLRCAGSPWPAVSERIMLECLLAKITASRS